MTDVAAGLSGSKVLSENSGKTRAPEIAHCAEGTDIGVLAAELGEAIHQTAVKGKLLVPVAVIFVACVGILAIDAERISSIRVVCEQPRACEVVHARRIVFGASEVL